MFIVYCNIGVGVEKKIDGFCWALLDVLRVLGMSTHVETKLWLLEIFDGFTEKVDTKMIYA